MLSLVFNNEHKGICMLISWLFFNLHTFFFTDTLPWKFKLSQFYSTCLGLATSERLLCFSFSSCNVIQRLNLGRQGNWRVTLFPSLSHPSFAASCPMSERLLQHPPPTLVPGNIDSQSFCEIFNIFKSSKFPINICFHNCVLECCISIRIYLKLFSKFYCYLACLMDHSECVP